MSHTMLPQERSYSSCSRACQRNNRISRLKTYNVVHAIILYSSKPRTLHSSAPTAVGPPPATVDSGIWHLKLVRRRMGGALSNGWTGLSCESCTASQNGFGQSGPGPPCEFQTRDSSVPRSSEPGWSLSKSFMRARPVAAPTAVGPPPTTMGSGIWGKWFT